MQTMRFRAAAVQAAPAFLDLDAGIAKAIALIAEAAGQGADLIVFPECWLPGYPWWIWLDSPAWGMQFVAPHMANCMTADGLHAQALAAAARAHGIFVAMGYSERAAGSLYIAQLLIDGNGNTVAARRKLKATHAERTVFGEGDGSDLRVHQTALGRIGALSCWEHLHPLNKFAMYAQDEQVHLAAWPSFSLYRDQAYALGAEMSNAICQVYAAEGQCFVVAACGVVSPAMIERLCDTPEKRALLQPGGGAAMIYGPDGRALATPLAPDAEGLVLADIDLGQIALAKAVADPAGHYARPDVARLLFNPAPQARVERLAAMPGAATRDAADAFTLPDTPTDRGAAGAVFD